MGSTTDVRDADAAELFRKYGPMALRRCRWMLGDAESAEDAMHEVFLDILEYRKPIDAERASGLIRRMATNRCLNIIRNRSRHDENADGESLLMKIAHADDMEERIGARRILRKLFGKHPVSSRTIAVLHLLDGMTLEETAHEVGMSVSGVQKRLRALRKTLGDMVKDDR